MGFGAPVLLVLAAVAAAVVAALHFIARRRPREVTLPTARFVPPGTARAAARARRPTDLVLLALRAGAVVLLGAAFAAPAVEPRWRGVPRVIVADVSAAVGDGAAVRDSVRQLWRGRDVVVAFDSTARVVPGDAPADSLAPTTARGSLSAGLAAGVREAHALRRRADRVEIVVVAALVPDEWDAATEAIRTAWPGRIRLVRVPARQGGASRRGVAVTAPADDPLAIAAGLAGLHRRADRGARLLRGAPGPADSTWARDSGGVLVHWAQGDTAVVAAAVVAGDAVLVAPLGRGSPPAGLTTARWEDGTPAASERRLGAGCLRTVAIGVSPTGDVALEPGLGRLAERLTRPCALVEADTASAPDEAAIARLSAPPSAGAAGGGTRALGDRRIAAALLAAAAALLAAEWLVRGRRNFRPTQADA